MFHDIKIFNRRTERWNLANFPEKENKILDLQALVSDVTEAILHLRTNKLIN